MLQSSPPHTLPANAQGIRHLEFRALGTHCSIKFRLLDQEKALTFAAEALGWLGRFEAKFSRYRADSVISKINAAASRDWVSVDPEMDHLLSLADDLYRRTDGILDPSMLPLVEIWNWKKTHHQLPSAQEVKTALALTGWGKIERRPGAIRLPQAGMGLDFGGFGKEYAVDFLARMARHHGIQDAMIDLGRDIFASGGNGSHPFWHVGIEDGLKPGHCWGGLAVSDLAVSASGDYARHFIHQGTRYGHILDPRSGWPVANGMQAVTVIAPSCLEAGAYSTAVFVLGAQAGLHLASLARSVEVCVQDSHGIDGSRGFGKFLVKAA